VNASALSTLPKGRPRSVIGLGVALDNEDHELIMEHAHFDASVYKTGVKVSQSLCTVENGGLGGAGTGARFEVTTL
jgi:hypothetical protein